jgi:hypothetical protein
VDLDSIVLAQLTREREIGRNVQTHIRALMDVYRKLIIEVADPQMTAAMLRAAINR